MTAGGGDPVTRVTKTTLPGGGWRVEKEFTDASGQQVKEVKITFPEPDEEEGEGEQLEFAGPPEEVTEFSGASEDEAKAKSAS